MISSECLAAWGMMSSASPWHLPFFFTLAGIYIYYIPRKEIGQSILCGEVTGGIQDTSSSLFSVPFRFADPVSF